MIIELDTVSVKQPETVSRFLGNFTFKTTQILRDINFKVFNSLLTKSNVKSITTDIDSSVINVWADGLEIGTKQKNPGL